MANFVRPMRVPFAMVGCASIQHSGNLVGLHLGKAWDALFRDRSTTNNNLPSRHLRETERTLGFYGSAQRCISTGKAIARSRGTNAIRDSNIGFLFAKRFKSGGRNTDGNKKELSPEHLYVLRCCGYSNHHTGLSGCGMVLYDATHDDELGHAIMKEVWSGQRFFNYGEEETKREAEYAGLHIGLQYAKYHGVKKILVQVDNDAMLKQLTGQNKVNKDPLKQLYNKVVSLSPDFGVFEVHKVKRKVAGDKASGLAREAVKTKRSLGIDFKQVKEKKSSPLLTNESHADRSSDPGTPAPDMQTNKSEEVGRVSEVRHFKENTSSPLLTDESHADRYMDPGTPAPDKQANNSEEVGRENIASPLLNNESHADRRRDPGSPAPDKQTNKSEGVGRVSEESIGTDIVSSDSECDAAALIDPSRTYVMRFDGGSRGNPGIAGCGMVLYDADTGMEVWAGRQYLETATNNEAEYKGLLLGLQCVRSMGVENIVVQGDSQLIVYQIEGKYKVKSKNLIPLFRAVRDLQKQFSFFEIGHIYRDKNGRADELANEAMDEKTSMGFEIL
eukprot:scaffold39755_cov52-Attheya_sp.AAC.11